MIFPRRRKKENSSVLVRRHCFANLRVAGFFSNLEFPRYLRDGSLSHWLLNWRKEVELTVTTTTVVVMLIKATAVASDSIELGQHADYEELVTIDHLMGIRDIKRVVLSPDGSHVAVLLRRADVEENTYRYRWVIRSANGGPGVEVELSGGETYLDYVLGQFHKAPRDSFGSWSPDSSVFAFTKYVDGESQIWTFAFGATDAQQRTYNTADVKEFFWSNDGKSLFYYVDASRKAMSNSRELAYKDGYYLDDISAPMYNLAPDPDVLYGVEKTLFSFNRTTGVEARVSDEERKNFESRRDEHRNMLRDRELTPLVRPIQSPESGWLVWTERARQARTYHDRSLHALSLNAPEEIVSCIDPQCRGVILEHFWNKSGTKVYFHRKEGVQFHGSGIYEWTISSGQVRTILRSKNPLQVRYESGLVNIPCQLADFHIFCVRETPTRPAHIVSIDVREGDLTVVFDPNPEFDRIRFGEILPVEFDTPPDEHQFGFSKKASGYVLLPPDFEEDKIYPLFVAPYRSAGFQRGDAGDEQPLHVYAANGIIVLNLNFPIPYGAIMTAADGNELMKALLSEEGGYPYYSYLAENIFGAVDELISDGLVDCERVAMGGVSQGSQVTAFALHKYDRLAAASIGSATWEPVMYYVSTQGSRELDAGDWIPNPELAAGRTWWDGLALSRNVHQVTAPILINAPDRELISRLQVFRRMNDEGKPIDVYVYPDEYHVKWQPAHRYNIYRRNLQWFKFWLQGIESDDAVDPRQYPRWRQWKEGISGKGSARCVQVKSPTPKRRVHSRHLSGRVVPQTIASVVR